MDKNLIDYFAENIKTLGADNPTFVAQGESNRLICKKLARALNSNYAFIKNEHSQSGLKTVIYGRIHPNAILIMNPQKTDSNFAENIELIRCAGARKVFVKRLEN